MTVRSAVAVDDPTDLDLLRREVRRLLDAKATGAALRTAINSDAGYDGALWQQLAGALGLAGVALPETHGGAGGGPIELGIVAEELGRTLTPSPFLASIAMAAQAVATSGDTAAAARHLPALASGSVTAALAVADADGSWALDAIKTTAVPDAGGYRITGTKGFVVDGHNADWLFVVAATSAGRGIFAVDATGRGVVRRVVDVLDPTRRLGHIELTAARGELIGQIDDSAVQRAIDLAVITLAAEQIGGAARCLEVAVEYAKVRVQFGRPIGSFQAIKHLCADMLLRLESAKSAVYEAQRVAAESDDLAELGMASAVAGAHASEAYVHIAKANIQIHGGMGYTWEHDAHLYLKRAKSAELLFVPPAQHRARVADLIDLGRATP